MNANEMATNLNRMAYELKRHKIIPEQSRRIIHEAASNVKSGSVENWNLIIPPERPLEFEHAESDDRLKPDIFCAIKASPTECWPVSSLKLVLRVWSTRSDISYREEWDSTTVKDKFDALGHYKRVMFRCHCDRSNPGQYAPLFHLQFGGNPRNDEYCWIPKFIELPRFNFPPIDLILSCEHVVATFFPSAYKELCQVPTWVALIKESEQFFLKDFYAECNKWINSEDRDYTILGKFCSTP